MQLNKTLFEVLGKLHVYFQSISFRYQKTTEKDITGKCLKKKKCTKEVKVAGCWL